MTTPIQKIMKRPSVPHCNFCYQTKNELKLNQTLKKCSRCKDNNLLYCSRNCQIQDWNDHKNKCMTPEEKSRQVELQREKLADEINDIAIKASADKITSKKIIKFIFGIYAKGLENELFNVLISKVCSETRGMFESCVFESWQSLKCEEIKNLIQQCDGKDNLYLCHICTLAKQSKSLEKKYPTVQKKYLMIFGQMIEGNFKWDSEENLQRSYKALLLFVFENCHRADINFVIHFLVSIFDLESFKQAFNDLQLFSPEFNKKRSFDYDQLHAFITHLEFKELQHFIFEQKNFSKTLENHINERLNQLNSDFIFNKYIFKILKKLPLSFQQKSNKKLINLTKQIGKMKIPTSFKLKKHEQTFFSIIQKKNYSSIITIILQAKPEEQDHYLNIVRRRINQLTKNNLDDYICSNIECAEFLNNLAKYLTYEKSSFQINLIAKIVDELYDYVTERAKELYDKFGQSGLCDEAKYKLYLLIRLAQVMPFPGATLFKRWSQLFFQKINYFDTKCKRLKLPEKKVILNDFKKYLTPKKIFDLAMKIYETRNENETRKRLIALQNIEEDRFICLIRKRTD